MPGCGKRQRRSVGGIDVRRDRFRLSPGSCPPAQILRCGIIWIGEVLDLPQALVRIVNGKGTDAFVASEARSRYQTPTAAAGSMALRGKCTCPLSRSSEVLPSPGSPSSRAGRHGVLNLFRTQPSQVDCANIIPPTFGHIEPKHLDGLAAVTDNNYVAFAVHA
jgi:hypothetical protein